jgi:hypothetical protein
MTWRQRTTLLISIGTPVLVVLCGIAWHYYRLHDGFHHVQLARAQVQSCGGWIDYGVNKGGFHIHLNNTDINDDQFIELASLLRRFPPRHLDRRHFIELHLANTNISDRSIAELPGIPLTALDVQGTNITDASIPVICRFSLWFLDLRNTRITDDSVSALQQLNLLILGVSGSRISDQAINELKDQQPLARFRE